MSQLSRVLIPIETQNPRAQIARPVVKAQQDISLVILHEAGSINMAKDSKIQSIEGVFVFLGGRSFSF